VSRRGPRAGDPIPRVPRREASTEDGSRYVYGDRHQFTKLATLLTHLGLILFLVAGLVTSRFGDELGLVIPEGESRTVQNIGTADLMLVKNNDFEAPGFDTGRPTDFATDLAVYQNGSEVARKTIRVNDPLGVGGYTFHQNGFGPAPHIVVKDASGAPLWDAKVPMLGSAGGDPYETMAVPGMDLGLQLLLAKDPSAKACLSSCRIASLARMPTGRIRSRTSTRSSCAAGTPRCRMRWVSASGSWTSVNTHW
jgi:hypothetical protein